MKSRPQRELLPTDDVRDTWYPPPGGLDVTDVTMQGDLGPISPPRWGIYSNLDAITLTYKLREILYRARGYLRLFPN